MLPFRKEGSAIKTRDMNLHLLPWPRDELAALGALEVELRVTLSYFVEPNPGERGWTRRHRYASHSLRFAVKRSLESLDSFRQRINKAAEVEEEGDVVVAPRGDRWVIAGLSIRISGKAALRRWPIATLLVSIRLVVGGRRSQRFNAGTVQLGTRF